MESSYFRKFTEPSLSSGIPHWISLYTRAPKFLIFSADRGLKFLKKNRNTVCKQAMHSQFTDPAPVAGAVWGGRGGLAGRRGLWSSCHWNALLYSTEQNRDSFRFPQVSFLFFPPLLFFSLFCSLLFLASLSSSSIELVWWRHCTPKALIIQDSLLQEYINENKEVPSISPLKTSSSSPLEFYTLLCVLCRLNREL